MGRKALPLRPLLASDLSLLNRKAAFTELLEAEAACLRSLPESPDGLAAVQQLERLAQTHERQDQPLRANGFLQQAARRPRAELDGSRMLAFRQQFLRFAKNLEAKKLSFELRHAFAQQYLQEEDLLKFQLHTVHSRRGAVAGLPSPGSSPRQAPPRSPRQALASSSEKASRGKASPRQPRDPALQPASPRGLDAHPGYFRPPPLKAVPASQRSAKKSERLIKTEASTTLVDFSARPRDSLKDYDRVEQLLFNRSHSNQLLEQSEDGRTVAPLARKTGPPKLFQKKSSSLASLHRTAPQQPRPAGWLQVRRLGA